MNRDDVTAPADAMVFTCPTGDQRNVDIDALLTHCEFAAALGPTAHAVALRTARACFMADASRGWAVRQRAALLHHVLGQLCIAGAGWQAAPLLGAVLSHADCAGCGLTFRRLHAVNLARLHLDEIATRGQLAGVDPFAPARHKALAGVDLASLRRTLRTLATSPSEDAPAGLSPLSGWSAGQALRDLEAAEALPCTASQLAWLDTAAAVTWQSARLASLAARVRQVAHVAASDSIGFARLLAETISLVDDARISPSRWQADARVAIAALADASQRAVTASLPQRLAARQGITIRRLQQAFKGVGLPSPGRLLLQNGCSRKGGIRPPSVATSEV